MIFGGRRQGKSEFNRLALEYAKAKGIPVYSARAPEDVTPATMIFDELTLWRMRESHVERQDAAAKSFNPAMKNP